MSIHYVSILPVFQTFSHELHELFILQCPKTFVLFLSECLIHLLQGELQDLRKVDLVKYRREVLKLT